MVDATFIITSIISLVAGGGVATLYTLRAEKHKKEIENDSQLAAGWKEMYEQRKADDEASRQEVHAVREKMATMEMKVSKLEQTLVNLSMAFDFAKVLECRKIGCLKREPKFDHKKYEQLAGCPVTKDDETPCE